MVYRHIRDLREDNDIKQITIAKHLGVAQNTYSQYENGSIDISPEVLIKLANFYNTSVDYLLDLTDEKKPYPKKTRGVM
ncbi:MAG: helix-turn-helix domain-containing protein [Oscillospiraceae bacterium]|nr:helix-turn-helix domain-containing protein [Oscillospiraceae bacterium]